MRSVAGTAFWETPPGTQLYLCKNWRILFRLHNIWLLGTVGWLAGIMGQWKQYFLSAEHKFSSSHESVSIRVPFTTSENSLCSIQHLCLSPKFAETAFYAEMRKNWVCWLQRAKIHDALRFFLLAVPLRHTVNLKCAYRSLNSGTISVWWIVPQGKTAFSCLFLGTVFKCTPQPHSFEIWTRSNKVMIRMICTSANGVINVSRGSIWLLIWLITDGNMLLACLCDWLLLIRLPSTDSAGYVRTGRRFPWVHAYLNNSFVWSVVLSKYAWIPQVHISRINYQYFIVLFWILMTQGAAPSELHSMIY